MEFIYYRGLYPVERQAYFSTSIIDPLSNPVCVVHTIPRSLYFDFIRRRQHIKHGLLILILPLRDTAEL